jgi:hypothetical protein
MSDFISDHPLSAHEGNAQLHTPNALLLLSGPVLSSRSSASADHKLPASATSLGAPNMKVGSQPVLCPHYLDDFAAAILILNPERGIYPAGTRG